MNRPDLGEALRKALVLESNDTLRQFLTSFLSTEFEVISASTGLEAMSKIGRGFIPDIIITHTQREDLNGAAFITNLRTSGLFGNIPVVAIGEADQEAEEHFRYLGVQAYFSKPFNPIQLHSRIIQILG